MFGDHEVGSKGTESHTESGAAAGQEKPRDLTAQRSKDLSPELFGENIQQLSVV